MDNTYQEQEQPKKKDSNKIYFLIAVILALLGTNAYLFLKDKKKSDVIVTLSDQKSGMQAEIDKIEAELDKSNSSNVKISDEMKDEQEIARKKILQLREQLKKGQLTQGQLAKAQEDVKQLRYFVTKYNADIEELQNQNVALKVERDSLKSTVSHVSEKATNLEKQNQELNTKVKTAAAIKAGSVSVTPLKVRGSGKEVDVTRASAVKKLRIAFNIVDNPLAQKGFHDIYLRIVEPSGNLLVDDNASMFEADGEELQYTFKTSIEFNNDAKPYNIDWVNTKDFQKGTYTVVLYADGYTMGKAAITLK